MVYVQFCAEDVTGRALEPVQVHPVPKFLPIDWEVLRDALVWQSSYVGAAALPFKLTQNAIDLTPASKMSMSLVFKVLDEVNIEALKQLAKSTPHTFRTSPLGLIHYLEDCTEFRRAFLDCHGKLKYGTETDVRIGRMRALYAKWVNMTQVIAEVWGPDHNKQRGQTVYTVQAKELSLAFIAPVTLQTVQIVIEGIAGTVKRVRTFFGHAPTDSVVGFLDPLTTGVQL
jgi:hypothetical protein